MGKIPPVEQTYYYAVPRDRVFSALTDPKLLAGWFVDKAVMTPRKGAPFRFTWGEYTMRSRVKAADAPEKLVLEWKDRFEGKLFETEVRFVLHKKGKGTVLTVRHGGFKDGKKWVVLYGAVQSGWAHYLTNLRSVLEHDVDLRSDLDAI